MYKHEKYSISVLMSNTVNGRRIEPEKRIKCLHHVSRGLRNQPEVPRYIWHKYPIKNGITGAHIMAENITRSNAIMNRLLKGK